MNLMVTICFDGTGYHGSQIQKNANTVQAEFQRALYRVIKQKVDIKCCSRTDTGVHANQFTISFHTNSDIQPDSLQRALNFWLPRDIRALHCERVAEDFHARYSAVAKRYIYKIYNGPVMDPFWRDRACFIRSPVDATKLNEAAQVFLGRHDFAAFCGSKNQCEDTFRTLSECSVHRSGQLVLITIVADGFLYNMARVIAGTLINEHHGKIKAEQIEQWLAGGVRQELCVTAPACGLYLDRVFYSDGDGLGIQ